MSTPSFPHSQLLLSAASPSVVISGHHIQTLDSSTGKIISSTSSLPPAEQEALQKAGPIRCAAIDATRTFVAAISDDKMLKVWAVSGDAIKLSSERELPKKPTSVAFSADGQTILVSDKFGDIFSYTQHPPPPAEPKSDEQTRDRSSFVSHPSTSGSLILGHTSLLTSFALSHDEKYIITADRDEHIRVSWYPQGYCIESYCLGCTKFISALHVPASQPSMLISGGGDHELKVWDWMAGTLKYDVPVWETVQDHIQVKVKPYKKGRGGEDNDGDEDEERPKGNKRRKKGGKGKESSEQAVADVPMDEPPTVKEETEVELERVLAIQKIETVSLGGKLIIIFSVIGGAALFSMECPTADNSRPGIHVYSLDKPVLDFCVVVGETPTVWISVDGTWPYEDKDKESVSPTDLVHVAHLLHDKLHPGPGDPPPAMFSTLNMECRLSGDARSLDLYAPLKSLPKNTHVEHNAMERPEEVASEGGEQALSKKEIGKLKSKKAVQERQKKTLGEEAGL